MRMLDLFSGIGGFSLAAQWTWGDDLDIAGFCEIDEYCHKVLKKNFPGVPIFNDIKLLKGEQFDEIDIITGGFPCQDISTAGRGAGIKQGTRSGLWFEMLRVISELRPRYALIENVPMLTIRGGTRVIADITSIGYDVEWQIIGADDVGAWHRRKRIWIVAYPRNGSDTTIKKQEKEKNRISKEHRQKGFPRMFSRTNNDREISSKDVPNTDKKRLQRSQETRYNGKNRQKPENKFSTRCDREREYWAVEPELGRVAHGIPSRVDRLKGLGNAIVPQVAQIIMQKIKECDERNI